MKLTEENIINLKNIHENELLSILYMVINEDIELTSDIKQKLLNLKINISYILDQYLKEEYLKK